jgi:hypothetical protein
MITFSRKAEVIWDSVDGRMTVCNVNSGDLIELSQTAGYVWEACEGRTADEITAILQILYPYIDVERLASDVRDFLEVLIDAALLELSETPLLNGIEEVKGTKCQ